MKNKVYFLIILLILIMGCKPEVLTPEKIMDEEILPPVPEGMVPPPPEEPVEEPIEVEDEVLPKKELCADDEKYMQMEVSGRPLLSMTFDLADHSTKYWGMIPFCARYRHSGQMHGAIDFELKPDAKVYAAESGVVESTSVGKNEGVGEIIQIKGNGFSIDYSGLKNLQFQVGDQVNKGDYIGQAVLIPHGEHHIHMGLVIGEKQECPLKYMDEEFREAVREVYAKSDFSSQTLDPCVCNCQSVEKKWS